MARISKKRKEVLKKIEINKKYTLSDASKLVKEIAKLGGNINNFVSDNIANKIKQKIYEVQS